MLLATVPLQSPTSVAPSHQFSPSLHILLLLLCRADQAFVQLQSFSTILEILPWNQCSVLLSQLFYPSLQLLCNILTLLQSMTAKSIMEIFACFDVKMHYLFSRCLFCLADIFTSPLICTKANALQESMKACQASLTLAVAKYEISFTSWSMVTLAEIQHNKNSSLFCNWTLFKVSVIVYTLSLHVQICLGAVLWS